MKTLAIVGIGALGTVGLTGAWMIGTFNTLVVAKNETEQMWSNVTTEYQRRADLILNLAEATKSYKKFEKETLTAVTNARVGNFGASHPEQMAKLKGLDKIFGRMMLTFEAYPNLKSSELYQELMQELRNTENRVNIVRTSYNEIVKDYNTYLMTFPTNLIGGMLGYQRKAFYEADVGVSKAPNLNLD